MKTIHGHFTPLLRHVLYSSLCFVTEKFGFFSRAQKLEKGPHRKGTEPVTQFSIWRVAAEGRDEDGDNCCNRKECCKYSFYSPCQGRALGFRGSAEGGVRGQRFSATCWSQTSTGSCEHHGRNPPTSPTNAVGGAEEPLGTRGQEQSTQPFSTHR